MWHLDVPKVRQYDHGKVEVVARNSVGESRVQTVLEVRNRHDDYRGVLKNSPRRELFWFISRKIIFNQNLNTITRLRTNVFFIQIRYIDFFSALFFKNYYKLYLSLFLLLYLSYLFFLSIVLC